MNIDLEKLLLETGSNTTRELLTYLNRRLASAEQSLMGSLETLNLTREHLTTLTNGSADQILDASFMHQDQST